MHVSQSAGEVRDDLDRVTPQPQGGLCTEIKHHKKRCSRSVILKANRCPRPRGIERKICTSNVKRNAVAAIFSRDTVSTNLESENVNVRYDNIELALRRGGEEGQGSKFSDVHRTCISIDLKWRSMSKTVFTQHDPFEPWYTCQCNVWLDVQRFSCLIV